MNTYRITDGPNGRVWWRPCEEIAEGYTYVRDATAKEAALMRRIATHRDPPPAWGDKIRQMIEQ